MSTHRRPPNWKEIVCPPAYFAHERKWIDFVMVGIVYLLSPCLAAFALLALPSTRSGSFGLLLAAAYVWLLCLAATPIPRLLKTTIVMLILSPLILFWFGLALLRY